MSAPHSASNDLRVNRRAALGLGTLGAVALAAGVSACAKSSPELAPFAGGLHQIGIAEPPRAFSLLAAFTCVAQDRAALVASLQALSAEAERISTGTPPPERDPSLPPPDTGVVLEGDDQIRVSLAAGASLFDRRFGLAQRRPAELVVMDKLANDRLDLARCHGDLLLTINSDTPDGCQHALRQIMRATRSSLVLRWTIDGYSRTDASAAGTTKNRNLLGFKDGTANPDTNDTARINELVWVGAGRNDGAEPAWTVGGSYQVVRIIRMLVERWDRASLTEQESIIGRHKVSGAPLGMTKESADPQFSDDPAGTRIPKDAHIRLANPRTDAARRAELLRRGFSYTRGFDEGGLLDQGLAFVSYQRSLEHFLLVQERIKGERLEEYTRTEGGGFYFSFPSPPTAGYLGQQLLQA